jgi:integrative and conjugative element protein (TIGR02256 family)
MIWVRDTPTSWRLYSHPKLKRQTHSEGIIEVPRFLVSSTALQVIERETQASPRKETGGILVGVIERNAVRVAAASGPGPRAVRTRSMFLRDKQYCSNFLNEHYQQNGSDYVGDWHSHIGLSAPTELSPGDIRTLTNVLYDPDYSDLPFFAVVLSMWSGKAGAPIELKGFIARRDWIGLVTLEEI